MANIDFSLYLRDYTGDFIIPDDVTSIKEFAFNDCAGLTSIEIPDSITHIGRSSFSGCTGLTSMVIPDSVTEIDDLAFYNCKNLTSVTIGNNVTSIGERVFCGCKNLTSIVWNAKKCTDFIDSNTPFHYFDYKHPYRECLFFDIGNQITSFTFGETVEHIPAFLCCRMSILKTIALPNSVTSIGKGAFFGCKGIDSIKIPQSITDIRSHSFRDCVNLKSVTFPSKVKSIGWHAFGGCAKLASIELSDSVTSIGSDAFKDCTSLVSIKIPQGVESIADEAFFCCKDLSSIEIPNSITRIGRDAFSGCGSLTSIIVPLGEEERFCEMDGLKDYADIIRKTSEKRTQQQQQRDEYEQRLLQEQQRQELFQDTILFFDTETNGLPRNYKASVSNSSNWPRLVQIAWIVTNADGKILKRKSEIIYPDGFTIPQEATDIHGITTERAKRDGKPLREVLDEFAKDLANAKQVVCHNVEFDQHIVGAELYRLNMDYKTLMEKPSICTMLSSTNLCAIPNPNGYDDYKWPKLSELYHKLFNRDFEDAHDALADITATKECFFELRKRGVI